MSIIKSDPSPSFSQIIGAVAEFEKDIIRERVRAGLENARQKGKRLGRPKVNNDILEKAMILRKQGLSFRRIERQLGVGEGTIRKRLKKLGIYYGKMDRSSQCYYLNKSR